MTMWMCRATPFQYFIFGIIWQKLYFNWPSAVAAAPRRLLLLCLPGPAHCSPPPLIATLPGWLSNKRPALSAWRLTSATKILKLLWCSLTHKENILNFSQWNGSGSAGEWARGVCGWKMRPPQRWVASVGVHRRPQTHTQILISPLQKTTSWNYNSEHTRLADTL